MRSTLSSGTRVQYTHPPNGSFWGTPSARTSVRLTPLGPIPRSDTPCAVGCDDRLLVRRNKLNVGSCRNTSSATTAGEFRMSSERSTLTLAGTLPSRCSVRDAVTVTSSRRPAGSSDTVTLDAVAEIDCSFCANPGASTTSVTSPEPDDSMVKRPSGPDTAQCSPSAPRAMTEAPGTTAPVASWTTPVTVPPARAARSENTAVIMGLDYTAPPFSQ